MAHPPDQFLQVKSATIDALSYGIDAPHKNSESPDSVFDKISEHYPRASRGTTASDDVTVPFVQHPLATIYVALTQRKIRRIYLGASGLSCCQWCEELLDIAERVFGPRVHRYCSRGHYPDGWLIPQGINKVVKEKMIARLKRNAENVFEGLNGKDSDDTWGGRVVCRWTFPDDVW